MARWRADEKRALIEAASGWDEEPPEPAALIPAQRDREQ